MKTLLSRLTVCLIAALVAQGVRAEDVKFDDHGLAFNHPKEWKVKSEAKNDVTTITLDNDKGTNLTITLNKPEVDPKLIVGELDKTFRKLFEGKIVKDSDKANKRKLLGAEREGQTMEIKILEGVTSKLEYYAFPTPSKKNTIGIVLTTTSIDPDGKKAVDKIVESLAEAKKK